MKHSSLSRILALALALILAAAALPMLAIGASADEGKGIVITIDPGHGPDSKGTNGAVAAVPGSSDGTNCQRERQGVVCSVVSVHIVGLLGDLLNDDEDNGYCNSNGNVIN